MSKFEDMLKQIDLDGNKFITLEGTFEEKKKKLVSALISFDKERLQKAIDIVHEGLSREETRELILSKGKKTDE